MANAFRDRIPAYCLVLLLHGAVLYAFLHAIIIEAEPPTRQERESVINLSRDMPAPPPQRRLPKPVASGSSAIPAPVFNPYSFQASPLSHGVTEGIAVALSACDPGRLDMASSEVRAVCGRIGMALKHDPGHFGVVSDVADPKHWQKELARREAPHLLACMKAHAPPLVGHDIKPIAELDLQTLLCVYRIVFIEYDSKNHEHYGQ